MTKVQKMLEALNNTNLPLDQRVDQARTIAEESRNHIGEPATAEEVKLFEKLPSGYTFWKDGNNTYKAPVAKNNAELKMYYRKVQKVPTEE